MADLIKAFIPLEKQTNFKGIDIKDYNEIITGASKTIISCDSSFGYNKLTEYLSKVNSKQVFTSNMKTLLEKNSKDVVLLVETSLMLGYICIDQLSGVIKYYVHNDIISELKAQNKAPRTAAEVFSMFLDKFGFIPVMYKTAKMIDLANGVSHRFSTIKMVMDDGDNSDTWSNSIKIQILAGINRFEYTPNTNKYYFVLQSKHGWYLKADTEKNEILKQKIAESKAKVDNTDTEEETVE